VASASAVTAANAIRTSPIDSAARRPYADGCSLRRRRAPALANADLDAHVSRGSVAPQRAIPERVMAARPMDDMDDVVIENDHVPHPPVGRESRQGTDRLRAASSRAIATPRVGMGLP
jgi:hypothetical protein